MDTNLLILTLLFVFNIILLLLKDKSVVYISFIIAIFTWFMSGYYLIIELDILSDPSLGLEGFYCLLVIIVSVLLFFEKGSEKW